MKIRDILQESMPEEWIFANTNTPAFRQWFGNSKVVDSSGRPLIVYHGRSPRVDFEVFRTRADREFGAHFGTLAQAAEFAQFKPRLSDPAVEPDSTLAMQRKRDVAKRNSSLYPVYLRIVNPYRTRVDLDSWHNIYNWRTYFTKHELDYLPYTQLRLTESDIERFRDIHMVRDFLVKRGYDGVTYPNGLEGEANLTKGQITGQAWIVFNPTQIKSIYNKGTWNPTDPSIYE